MDQIKRDCSRIIDHICANLGEELDSPGCRDIKKHLENCSSCRDYFVSVERTIQFYKNYNVSLTEEGHNRLMKILGLGEKLSRE